MSLAIDERRVCAAQVEHLLDVFPDSLTRGYATHLSAWLADGFPEVLSDAKAEARVFYWNGIDKRCRQDLNEVLLRIWKFAFGGQLSVAHSALALFHELFRPEAIGVVVTRHQDRRFVEFRLVVPKPPKPPAKIK